MRYPSIDILRTLAIFLMVMVHFSENLSGYTFFSAELGAPLFSFLSGVSYCLWLNAQKKAGSTEENISKVSIRRGLFLIGIGFAFNILIWLPEDTFNWDVLTFLGTALLVLNVTRRFPLAVSVLLAILSLLVSPFLRSMVDYATYWESGHFEYDLTMSDVLIGFLATGFFPFFPWITFSLAGYVTSSFLFTTLSQPTSSARYTWPAVFLGLAFIATAMLALCAKSLIPQGIANHFLEGWTMFPATTEYILGTLGITIVLLGVMHHIVDSNPRLLRYEGCLSVAKTFSRYSLTIYVLHHIVHLWPLWIYGLATGNEPTYFWMDVMPVALSLPLGALFLAITYFLLRWLGPERSISVESWMRWLCD